MFNPLSTYRLQFHKGFTFKDCREIIPYLQSLGIKTVYAAPVFEATPGSSHGYDVVNPHRINPEIGTIEEFKKLCRDLKQLGIGWIQDIVPNHMAYHSNNPWIMDVLEKGKLSVYADFFDINWDQGKLMVPFLGASVDEVIQNGEVKVDYQKNMFVFQYYDSFYPLNPSSYVTVLETEVNIPEKLKGLLSQIKNIIKSEDKQILAAKWEDLLLHLEQASKDDEVKLFKEKCLEHINQNAQKLEALAKSQEYELCFWQETDKRINFRRFFTINGLICLNIHKKQVFDHYHILIRTLLQEKTIDGLRVDHIDGLYDPGSYLKQLRELAGEDAYIVVEKILEPGECLPEKWPIQGNTGYDFLALTNNLLIQKNSGEKFTKFYSSLTDNTTSIHQQIHDKKGYILKEHMRGELENLSQLFLGSELVDKKTTKKIDLEQLKEAIGEVLIQCPVYRYYGNQFPLEKEEDAALRDIFTRIRKSRKDIAIYINLLEQVLLKNPLKNEQDYNHRALAFYQRLMQFSGPLMAKGVEDTLMYTYTRYLGNNEVGDSPETFGISAKELHKNLQQKQFNWPLSMNASATHDTKRGEDANARLSILTDLPEEWFDTVKEWQKLNGKLKENNIPDSNDEYFIYQALLANYPMPDQADEDFSERFSAYLIKALREAKRHSNWTEPNESYESGALDFVRNLLDKKKPFWKSFSVFHKKVSDFGILNSLSKVLLKFTAPGVPDLYQGCEMWDLSMVDPDNRRPVDYKKRNQWLKEIKPEVQKSKGENFQILWNERYNGKIKLWITKFLLKEREQNPELFREGHYYPLQIEGKQKDHVIAYARRHKDDWYIFALPVNVASLSKNQKKDILTLDWADTAIILPPEAPEEWESMLFENKGKSEKLAVKDLFKEFPLAVVKLKQSIKERSAGILMHITSLPSRFGVGDLGPEARAFADFLSRSRQKYWQILPLNPTELGTGHSPYSSISSMAGNTLLLSPILLAKDGLLTEQELKKQELPSKEKADYAKSEKVKSILFESAFRNYQKGALPTLKLDFQKFCKQESFWMDDFALFVVLKQYHAGKAWFQWKNEYKNRDTKALQEFLNKFEEAILKVKWLQFMFARQWKDLRTYCNNQGIELFGDLPFYVSYDSADVWANPDIFSLDAAGNMIGVAGVPPDYFNSDGQLWGMPVFRWDKLKNRNYDWWIQRLRKNMELYNVLRLDHFRAFADYWEVGAGEKTAINGEWKLGPGADFFNAIKKELGDLPFIAEDLGDINEGVHQLRDAFSLPGMKVLQFAFGDDMPESIYAPHNHTTNYIVYTGTHDNNTTKGWYRKDAGKTEHLNLVRYTGLKIRENDVHMVLGRMAYASVAKTAILPIQDVLGLDETARMNTPASVKKNWQWRMRPGQINVKLEDRLREWAKAYNRG